MQTGIKNQIVFGAIESRKGPPPSHATQVAYPPLEGPISRGVLFHDLFRVCLNEPLYKKPVLCTHFMALGQMKHVRFVVPLECRPTFCEDMEFHDKATVLSNRVT
jgi:hypothetical protein